MKKKWRRFRAIAEGLLFGGLMLSLMGDLIWKDLKWLILTIIVAGSFIADGIDEALEDEES